MKIIYLVRHGESTGNVGDFRQGPETPLSVKGVTQSETIANRLKNVEFDLIVSSPLKRTMQTAELISQKTNHKIIESDLFKERERPSRQYGLKKDSVLNLQIEEEFMNAFKTGEKYEDAESFSDIKTRVKEAIKYLEESKEKRIVVVTHGTFSRFLAGFLLLGESSFNLENALNITKVFKKSNTGITKIVLQKFWRIASWNDFSHFADED